MTRLKKDKSGIVYISFPNNFMIDKFNRQLRDLRISVIDNCNFRCPYCMPADQFHHQYEFLKKQQWLSVDEIERVSRIFVKLGVKKLRLTGGEPLLRPDLLSIIERLALIEGIDDLALTTNGSLLNVYAKKLHDAGLKRLTVSLDSLDQDIFTLMSGGKGKLEDVLAGIEAARSAGFSKIKVNAVIKKGVNESSILDLTRFSREAQIAVRFIEYMDVGNQNNWSIADVISAQSMIEMISDVYPLVHIGSTDDGETSERYRCKDGLGELGFIASVTKAFCGTCNRLRLSADGKIYTCLFATQGTDVCELLRNGSSDEVIEKVIYKTWQNRDDRYSQLRQQIRHDTPNRPKVEMYHIGG